MYHHMLPLTYIYINIYIYIRLRTYSLYLISYFVNTKKSQCIVKTTTRQFQYDSKPTTSHTTTLIARYMGPTWGPSGADRAQMGPMLAPWTLLSGKMSCWWPVQTSHGKIAAAKTLCRSDYANICNGAISRKWCRLKKVGIRIFGMKRQL